MRIKRGALTRTTRPPNAMRIKRGASTRTMRPQNAMQMKSGEPTRNLSGVRGSNTTIYYLGCGQAQLSALFCCLDYTIKPPCELEISLYLAAAARSHIEQSVGR
jgi:hypothetical protein